VALAVMFPLVRRLFNDPKERSIAMVAALIGNTGNLGIPLGIAIFGQESIPYTTVINLVNVFVVYTIGVYYYSRGSFDIKTSIANIFKLPAIWAAFVAIGLNLWGYQPSPIVEQTLMMGAYASMTIQLMLFGIYLYGVKLKEINRLLIGWVSGVKFLLLPLLTWIVLSFVPMDSMIKGILFLELMMPLAVANVNLAALYECRPRDVTALIFITSLLFLVLIFGGVKMVGYL
jgi:malate permease and related proteins